MILSRCKTSDVGTLDFFAFLTRIFSPQRVEEQRADLVTRHPSSTSFPGPPFSFLFFPFFPDRPTHQQERERDGKGNILGDGLSFALDEGADFFPSSSSNKCPFCRRCSLRISYCPDEASHLQRVPWHTAITR